MISPHAVALHNLRVDEVTAEVLRAFEAAAVPSILLKGPSTARWLHGEPPRRYQDCDLLVGPAAIDAAERVLGELGFAPALRRAEMPAWWRDHAIEWVHRERFAAVDLHRTLKGVGVGDERLWQVLRSETEQLPVGGVQSTILTPPARALLLALDGVGDGAAKGDLVLAVERIDDETWRRAAHLAAEVGADTVFAIGLRLTPAGRALADRLGLPEAPTVEATLRAERAAPGALTLERFASASGWRERLSITHRKLFPPRTFMHHWSYRARDGRLALLAAYVRRLAWVARRTPRALRAWRRARRAARQGPPAEA